jgi:hypothetical protein
MRLKAFFSVLLFLGARAAAGYDAPFLQPLWKTAGGGAITGNGALYGGTAAFLSEDSRLYIIEPETGDILGKHRTAEKVRLGPVSLPGGILLAEHTDRSIGMYNRRGGHLLSIPLPGKLAGEPAVDRRGIVYAAAETGHLLSYTHSGRKRWEIRVGDRIVTNPVLTAEENRVCVLADTGMFWITDSGSMRKNSVPYDPRNAVRLFSLPGQELCVLFPDRFIITDETGAIRATVPFPFSFQCTGGGVYLEGFFAFVGRDKTMLFYTADGNGPARFFSVRLLAEGVPAGYALYRQYLILGSDDWVFYGYQLPRSLSAVPPEPPRERVAPALPLPAGADFELLGRYAGSSGRREQLLFLEEIEERLTAGTLGGDDLFALNLLENMIGKKHGGTAGSAELYDELADIRSRAVILMGKMGNLETQRLLSRVLPREDHPDVRKSIIRALALLRSDPKGAGLSAVRRISAVNNTIAKDAGLVSEILFFADSVKNYHGLPVSGGLLSLLHEIFLQDYPRNIRKQALELMETE